MKIESLNSQPIGVKTIPKTANTKTVTLEAIGSVLKMIVHGHKSLQEIFWTITGCSAIDEVPRLDQNVVVPGAARCRHEDSNVAQL